MNKQQLAARIWTSAQKMRSSKIEAQQYKDYLLGFIFYKFLSSNEMKFLKRDGYPDDELHNLTETNKELVEYIQNGIGYFIPYKHLYTTWLAMGSEFSVGNVSEALSSFNRHINPTYKHVFKDIFRALENGLSDFGETTGSMTKAISDLLGVIRDIPTDGQGYDVLGFIYEYLISNFAATAGKKAGEFYTPHEVSELMSEIVAEHLKNYDSIKIYDPTSGSGSLLLTIGRAVGKHIIGRNRVDYYAQELVESTFNLTRMNLVMREVGPAQINVCRADTLAEDWPVKATGKPLRVDAVVSNPPYSQGWNPVAMKHNPRFEYGLAPKGKADYAFLLHALYHLDTNGIMTIVLPTGVLSRGEEYEIRKNLIEHGHIKAVIALPPNIFYGTNIPTIIMVLCQKRRKGEADDVLFINATDCFVKQGKKNILRASDIRRIADAVRDRKSIPHFAYLASKKTVAEYNDYNLHIPRYVQAANSVETEDLYAHIFGGIPDAELEEMADYWRAFPTLREQLFTHPTDTPYSELKTTDATTCINADPSVCSFKKHYATAFQGLDGILYKSLIKNMMTVKTDTELTRQTEDLFNRVALFPLVNKYTVYQTLSDHWQVVASDIEVIQTEGFDATRKVDAVTEIVKAKDGSEDERFRGWQGRIIPFDLVQQTLLKTDAEQLQSLRQQLDNMQMEFNDVRGLLTEEEQDRYLDEERENFDFGLVNEDYRKAVLEVETPDILTLKAYLTLTENGARKAEKLAFVQEHPEFNWEQMHVGRDGTYGKTEAKAHLCNLQYAYVFDADSTPGHLRLIVNLLWKKKDLETDIKRKAYELEEKTVQTIQQLADTQVLELLRLKWIDPLCHELAAMPEVIIQNLTQQVLLLEHKYADTLHQINADIAEAESALSSMLGKLRGNAQDMEAIAELGRMLQIETTGAGAQLLKTVCSEKMLPQEGTKVPQVRFEGFEDEWEEKIIGESFRIFKNNTYPRAELNYISGDIKNIHYGDVLIKYGSCINVRTDVIPFITSEESAKKVSSSLLKEGDIIVADTAEDETVGKCSEVINIGETKVVSGLHTIPLRPIEGFSQGYMGFFMNSSTFHNQLRPYMQGSKVLAISKTSIKEIPVRFPHSAVEQHLIAQFFLTLDRLISLRARQLEKLKALKTGFLQKMFV